MTCSARPPLGSSPIAMSRWGNRVVLTGRRRLPVYPYEQTISDPVGLRIIFVLM